MKAARNSRPPTTTARLEQPWNIGIRVSRGGQWSRPLLWADRIVVVSPALDDDLGLLPRMEDFRLRQLIAQAGVEGRGPVSEINSGS
jgi:hypothetical protein